MSSETEGALADAWGLSAERSVCLIRDSSLPGCSLLGQVRTWIMRGRGGPTKQAEPVHTPNEGDFGEASISPPLGGALDAEDRSVGVRDPDASGTPTVKGTSGRPVRSRWPETMPEPTSELVEPNGTVRIGSVEGPSPPGLFASLDGGPAPGRELKDRFEEESSDGDGKLAAKGGLEADASMGADKAPFSLVPGAGGIVDKGDGDA